MRRPPVTCPGREGSGGEKAITAVPYHTSMTRGAFDTFLARNTDLQYLIQHFEYMLYEAGFACKEHYWWGHIYRGRYIWGDSAKAFLVSGYVPFGSLMKDGNRYGAEFEIYQSGPNAVLRLLVVPYMAIFDRRDIFLLSQGILESITDDKHCRNFMNDILSRLQYKGIYLEPYRGQH